MCSHQPVMRAQASMRPAERPLSLVELGAARTSRLVVRVPTHNRTYMDAGVNGTSVRANDARLYAGRGGCTSHSRLQDAEAPATGIGSAALATTSSLCRRTIWGSAGRSCDAALGLGFGSGRLNKRQISNAQPMRWWFYGAAQDPNVRCCCWREVPPRRRR